MRKTHVLVVPLRCKKNKSKNAKNKKHTQVCAITSRGRGEWLLPKGWRESRVGDKKMAQLEAFEEAGIVGKIKPVKDCNKLKLVKGKPKRNYKVFVMKVTDQLKNWPEKRQRKRKWLAVGDKALNKQLCSKALAKLVRNHAA